MSNQQIQISRFSQHHTPVRCNLKKKKLHQSYN